ncbi:MAG: glycosyltransferase [Caldilineaceae bacterium]|nr:glycosyltransferase [Caldilineaceae bacterium]
MHVVMVSKALVVGAYQRKAEEIARRGVKLTVLVPPSWRDRRGRQVVTAQHTEGYTLRTIPLWLNGNFHLHCYPTLARELAHLQPDLLHMDEEPYNLATYLALGAARRLGIPALFFTWQNLMRNYPPPFAWWERANYRSAGHALAGNQDAAAVLRSKGYQGPLTVVPQFGVDPAIFTPASASHLVDAPLRIGYAGGLLPEKGLDLLLRACAALQGAWQLTLVGEGESRTDLVALAAELGIADRVRFDVRLESHAMPAFYRNLDAFVLPSRTLPTWKEQFGRVLIEAMSCAVPVVGSMSGEIPNVLGGAGLLFAEGDVDALAGHLQRLLADPTMRATVGQAGRARVLAHYTMQQVAAQTVDVYHALLGTEPGRSSSGSFLWGGA